MAGPLTNNTTAQFAGPPYLQAFRPASSMSANRFDEGYSEDTRSQSGSDMVMRTDSRLGEGLAIEQDSQYPLPDWVLNMSENDRSEFAYAILRSLRTSSIAGIVEKLNPLLHLDPVIHLPPEITFQIFSYLTPETLLHTSTLSRAWRTRVMDSPLWKLLFRMEGWNSNFPQVRAFEEAEKGRRSEMRERKTRARGAEEMEYEKPSTKKRLRERPLLGDGGSSETGIHDRLEPLSLDGSQDSQQAWGEQHSLVEADDSPTHKAEDRMEGVAYQDSSSATSISERARRNRGAFEQNEDLATPPTTSNSLSPPIRPSLLLTSIPEPRINWQYLYKQKKRLEDNWDAGRFSNFQLPHPNHPLEAHTECVYTIQYSGKYLVSGSRDKTVRIWNLDTQRLVLPPLTGHSASVLCLQFDERPGQDVVISGGSDCHVILWRFSTGQLIKKLEKAHTESVLNLRFDDRYLVTCSKDKTIKVWNRNQIWPTDEAYPTSTTKGGRFPSYIINMQHQVENQHLHFKVLEPYNLVMTLEGHGAAVNAIQILDGQIVSASGDRSVKVWDVHTGACLRTFSGHSKGIACVQFDGRRIVSGSSDETVRIFDRATGAEVACLQGHSNLVRTVQAQFGDLPGNEEELEAEARAVDRNFFEARDRGLISDEMSRAQRRARNAGSRDPKAIFAYGAKLPPGGGGSKWARIVSGSYDETVIIWKKGPDGAWAKSKTLHQNEAVKAAGGRPRRPVQNHAHANHLNAANQNQQQQHVATHAAAPHAAQTANGQPNFHALAQQAHAQAQAAQSLAQQAQALHAASQALHHGNAPSVTAHVATTTTHNASATHANQGPANQTHAPGPAQQQQQQGAAPNAAPHHHHHAPHHHHHPLAGPLNTQGTNSRVFKLQFDARRIICCSQDPTIVGWDFANGDKDIIQASQFFGDSV
ncbi:WD40 repeat-like protein [Zopfia rhizophila CBS 207.26]|uniref:WD40 repeat-like protein n=1 Tax=Zopfia rhizophila CBS 207.26 TaxID=1314779 RepID=A0A6A6DFM7_9PEZI|nr:WD40 repeat-like protein [Zopfia rhizophila CBS 207.26]